MKSPFLVTRPQALKMGYFYWLVLKIRITLIIELSLGNSKDTKFYLESKASFTHISSIASFKPFLTAWSWEYCTFWPGQFSGLLEVLDIVLCDVIEILRVPQNPPFAIFYAPVKKTLQEIFILKSVRS